MHAHDHAMQGHILAAQAIGDIYYWGKGVAKDYERAMAAYKVAAEAGDAFSQHQVGGMYYDGHGVAVDYQQARAWLEKAAAQDDPKAVGELGGMYLLGEGVTPSMRRAQELTKRGIELGSSESVKAMPMVARIIQKVRYPLPLSSSIPRVMTHIIRPRPSHAQYAPLMDKRVRIHGTSRNDINGKCGVATDFHMMGELQGDRSTWRYSVRLDSGEAFKVKPANVRAEGAGAGAGAGAGGAKGKGKGKKGKKGRGGRS